MSKVCGEKITALQLRHHVADDAFGIRERHYIGVDNLCWGNDYPHTESTFPRSQQIMGERLRDVSADERDKILQGNVARIYGFRPQ